MSCFELPGELIARPGLFEKVLEVAAANPPYKVPAPTRAELEELVS
jgi:hypothetical protein